MYFINLEILVHLNISATEDVPMSHKNGAFQFSRIHMMARRLEIPPPKGFASCPSSVLPSQKHARKVMLKILQARLQQYMNHELPDT